MMPSRDTDRGDPTMSQLRCGMIEAWTSITCASARDERGDTPVTGPSIVVAEAMDIIAQTDVPESIGSAGEDRHEAPSAPLRRYGDGGPLEDIFTHEMMQSSSTAPGVATGNRRAGGWCSVSSAAAYCSVARPPCWHRAAAAPVTAPTDMAGPSTNLPPSGEV